MSTRDDWFDRVGYQQLIKIRQRLEWVRGCLVDDGDQRVARKYLDDSVNAIDAAVTAMLPPVRP